MGLLNNKKRPLTAARMKRLLNWFGPYLGAGVKVEYIAEDWQEVRVSMRMKWYNKNAVGTHFGGSLYAMIDPHFMLMLMQLLGKGYVVWDKSASIDFIKPGKGTLTATMTLDQQALAEIKAATATGEKYLPEYVVEIFDQQGEVVARANKTLYIRRKQ